MGCFFDCIRRVLWKQPAPLPPLSLSSLLLIWGLGSKVGWNDSVLSVVTIVPGSPVKTSFTPSFNTGWFCNAAVFFTWIFIFSHRTLSGCLSSFERHFWHSVSIGMCLHLKESVVIQTLLYQQKTELWHWLRPAGALLEERKVTWALCGKSWCWTRLRAFGEGRERLGEK